MVWCRCPKILYTEVTDKIADAKLQMQTADPDQMAPEQDLHCMPFF